MLLGGIAWRDVMTQEHACAAGALSGLGEGRSSLGGIGGGRL